MKVACSSGDDGPVAHLLWQLDEEGYVWLFGVSSNTSYTALFLLNEVVCCS